MTATQPTSTSTSDPSTPAGQVVGQVGGEDSIDQLIREESERFLARQPASGRLIERARRRLAGGATSNWQIADPQAVWMSHGSGSRIFDVDGAEYSDFHGGYGVSLAGHAPPGDRRAR